MSGDHQNNNINDNGQNIKESPGDCCHSNSSERLSAKTDMKNSQGVDNDNNNNMMMMIMMVVMVEVVIGDGGGDSNYHY